MTMPRVLDLSGQSAASVPATGANRRVRFLLLQLFALIYLQKFAIGSLTTQISVPMAVLLGGIAWMLLSGDLVFVPIRLATYFIFIGFCLLSQILNGAAGSPMSLLYLVILYSFMTVTIEITEDEYKYVFDKFVKFMIVPAIIILVQYGLQKATGRPDPINMERFVPRNFLLQGFMYAAHYPWNSPFSRPNGFFFLEPSYASAFAAMAVVIELMYFKRTFLVGLMLLATVFSLGGTGMLLLVIAAPFLLARQTARFAILVITAAVVALLFAYLADLPLPLVSRLDELHSTNTSGAARLLRPAVEFISLVVDPAFLFVGDGAGSITGQNAFGTGVEVSPWPMVKLMHEYGFLATASFLVFYMCGIVRTTNVALAVPLSVIYHFTASYLLMPIMVEILVLFCLIVAPLSPALSRSPIGPDRSLGLAARALSSGRAIRPGLGLRPP